VTAPNKWTKQVASHFGGWGFYLLEGKAVTLILDRPKLTAADKARLLQAARRD
jgi:hypothetical protein